MTPHLRTEAFLPSSPPPSLSAWTTTPAADCYFPPSSAFTAATAAHQHLPPLLSRERLESFRGGGDPLATGIGRQQVCLELQRPSSKSHSKRPTKSRHRVNTQNREKREAFTPTATQADSR